MTPLCALWGLHAFLALSGLRRAGRRSGPLQHGLGRLVARLVGAMRSRKLAPRARFASEENPVIDWRREDRAFASMSWQGMGVGAQRIRVGGPRGRKDGAQPRTKRAAHDASELRQGKIGEGGEAALFELARQSSGEKTLEQRTPGYAKVIVAGRRSVGRAVEIGVGLELVGAVESKETLSATPNGKRAAASRLRGRSGMKRIAPDAMTSVGTVTITASALSDPPEVTTSMRFPE